MACTVFNVIVNCVSLTNIISKICRESEFLDFFGHCVILNVLGVC